MWGRLSACGGLVARLLQSLMQRRPERPPQAECLPHLTKLIGISSANFFSRANSARSRGRIGLPARQGVSCRQREVHLRTVRGLLPGDLEFLNSLLHLAVPSQQLAQHRMRRRRTEDPPPPRAARTKWLYLDRRAPHIPRQWSPMPGYVSGSAPVLSDIRAGPHPDRSPTGTIHRDSGRWAVFG